MWGRALSSPVCIIASRDIFSHSPKMLQVQGARGPLLPLDISIAPPPGLVTKGVGGQLCAPATTERRGDGWRRLNGPGAADAG
ncbi:unnamed protein product [Urochloa humidicola]